MPQKARLRSIERFSSPSSPSSILIATDVAARGLDIPSVQLVIHYHLPRAADMYVHRSGRTARASSSGSSILLCAPEEVLGVRRLVAKVHARNASLKADDGNKFFIRTIELDRRIVARLKPRVTLSKKISDASLAKEKKGHEENWLRTAAEDLGVDYDTEDFDAQDGSKKGRGHGRKKAEKVARGISKGALGALRAELRQLLSRRVNVGVSEKYLTAGGLDVNELLSGVKSSEFLGIVDKWFDMVWCHLKCMFTNLSILSFWLRIVLYYELSWLCIVGTADCQAPYLAPYCNICSPHVAIFNCRPAIFRDIYFLLRIAILWLRIVRSAGGPVIWCIYREKCLAIPHCDFLFSQHLQAPARVMRYTHSVSQHLLTLYRWSFWLAP